MGADLEGKPKAKQLISAQSLAEHRPKLPIAGRRLAKGWQTSATCRPNFGQIWPKSVGCGQHRVKVGQTMLAASAG